MREEPERTNPVAMSVLVEMDGMKFGTKSDTKGVRPLGAVGTLEPDSGFKYNKESFDYSGWTPVEVVEFLRTPIFENFAMLDSLGAKPVCTSPGNAAPGTYGFRIDAPYC